MKLDLNLPTPWAPGTTFHIHAMSHLTWLVGPNGTGKSRFLRALRDHPALAPLNPRLLTTDRLSGARSNESWTSHWGDQLAQGLPRTSFSHFISGNHRDGTIIGTAALLHERPDLRIRVEATLSQLLNRHIGLDMTDGNLRPTVRYGLTAYPMFSDECHGVLELLALLTNIYDSNTKLLLIDEPELNLHPQYQAFVLDEIRRLQKRVVVATHSPSFLAIETLSDLEGIICFHSDFTPPSTYVHDAYRDKDIAEILPRMTEQHRGFFFATLPVFVEGYLDAAIVSHIQRSLGRSMEASGSCLIPSMGKGDAGRYLLLCKALGKRAVFLFDLDALFDRRIRLGATNDADLVGRISEAGHGTFDRLAGNLLRTLTSAVTTVESSAAADAGLPPQLMPLSEFIRSHPGPDHLDSRRIAVLIDCSEHSEFMRLLLGGIADEIRGFLKSLLDHLSSVDIHVLPGGALENYLPSYKGNRFVVPSDVKRDVVAKEQSWLTTTRDHAAIRSRYGGLISIVEKLPARKQVDILPMLRRELANVLHSLIMAIREGRINSREAAPQVLQENWKRVAYFLQIEELTVRSPASFSGTLLVSDQFGLGTLGCSFDETTNTNNPEALRFKTVDASYSDLASEKKS